MPGRPLPNFDLYLDKLGAYAKACEITIEYRDEPGDGAYIPARRKIVLDKDLPESTEIATFLHELGHSLDDKLYDKIEFKKLDRLYKLVYKGKLPAAKLPEVLECEKRAWVFGRAIAKKLRIPLGSWYSREEAEALSHYEQTETKP